jgi:23S rRNA G2445 N2-methylase RlmL
MFRIALLLSIGATTTVAAVVLVRVGRALIQHLDTLRNHITGQDIREFISFSTERAIRVTESEHSHTKTSAFKKKITFAEGILNDVIREAGVDVSKFNVKGLIQAKLQEIGMDWSKKA